MVPTDVRDLNLTRALETERLKGSDRWPGTRFVRSHDQASLLSRIGKSWRVFWENQSHPLATKVADLVWELFDRCQLALESLLIGRLHILKAAIVVETIERIGSLCLMLNPPMESTSGFQFDLFVENPIRHTRFDHTRSSDSQRRKGRSRRIQLCVLAYTRAARS